MERHPTDFTELFFGLAFLAAGGGFLVRQTTDQAVDPAWVAAIALVTIGCAFLALTVLRRPRPELIAPTPPIEPIEPTAPTAPTPPTEPIAPTGERGSEGPES
jgi:outer membrane biosynthesis protein TonB